MLGVVFQESVLDKPLTVRENLKSRAALYGITGRTEKKISCCNWKNAGRWTVMREVAALVDRNCKLFFKDKGMLFSSMITPLILIVLYATFLAKVYKDSYTSAFNNMIELSDKMINGAVAAQLAAALIAVSCVTVTFNGAGQGKWKRISYNR